MVLYSFAAANPSCPVSSRLTETCFPTVLISLLCNSTIFLLTANTQISAHCLLHCHLAGENCAVTSLGLRTFCLATEPLPNRMYNSYVLPAFSSKLALIWVSFLHTATDFYETWLKLNHISNLTERQKGSKPTEEGKVKNSQTFKKASLP